jgi:hypothetical protein
MMAMRSSRISEQSAQTVVAGTAAGSGTWYLIGASTVGAVVALSLGFYGRSHTPTGAAVAPFQLDSLLVSKVTLASVGLALALAQLASALWMYGRLTFLPAAPSSIGTVHRWSGTAAFLVTLPVAYHCLWGLGFQTTTTRVLVHSLLGCAFYGAFSTKLLSLRSRRLPGWALPAIGGSLVMLLVGLWLTSAFWYLALRPIP